MRSGVRLVPLKSRCGCGGAGIRLNLKAGGESYYFGVDGGGADAGEGRGACGRGCACWWGSTGRVID
jgi:hypothetical protein